MQSLAVLITLFTSLPAFADIWTIEPNECLVDTPEAFCETTITFTLQTASEQNMCVYEEQRLISCFTPEATTLQVTMKINRPVVFTLKDEAEQVVSSGTIAYTVINQNPKRRRVKPPWSLF